jgi:uncharacterized repeat protein (TIGR01451 family)
MAELLFAQQIPPFPGVIPERAHLLLQHLTWDIDAQCPGSPFTLNNGDTLNIAFDLATDCTAVSGSLNTYIDYQISGTPFCDNTGAHSIQVLPGGVTIKKTPNVIPQELWQNVTWTLTIENTGFGVIENVVVTDVLDAGLAYVSSSPAGVNAGQITTWGTTEIPQFASMNPGDKITIDITATVIACQFLENNADVRWGCDLVTDCYNTANTIPPSTATASVQRIVKTPLIQYPPPQTSALTTAKTMWTSILPLPTSVTAGPTMSGCMRILAV